MDINLTTPALLFPAISLLMLAYTNRFLGLATVIRTLHANYQTSPNPVFLKEIDNLRTRILLIRDMQLLGLLSLLLCTLCMFVFFAGFIHTGTLIFGASLIAMILSLCFSLWEIFLSVGALNLHLQDIEQTEKNHSPVTNNTPNASSL